MSNPLRKKRANPVIWILMAMLILGLGGFGARNFGGSIRSIGTVGDRDIDLQDYARALNQEISAFSNQIGQPVSFAQAQSMGIDSNVRERVLATTALDNEADKIGISVGDDEVRRRIVEIQAFKGLDGKFDRDSYTLALQREGLGEAEFESKLRDEAARNLLQTAVLGATVAPDAYTKVLADWIYETRDFTLAELIPADLTEPVAAPSEDDLTAYYAAHPQDFTRPEIRKITYLWLAPEMLSDQVQLDEAALRKTYDENIDKYVTPERRMVERLVYPSAAEASAAKARLDAGEVDFAALAAERGLTLEDIDLGEVSKADLGAAGDAVFALTGPGVVGPFSSEFGPALFSMNAILDAREVTFDEALDDLSAEAIMDGAR
ncbi:MAG: peptidylprolyl isomerase, partial [Albidovulum sp.]